MQPTRRKRANLYERGLRLEPLERRRLLAINVQGIPSYLAEGPGPVAGGQADVKPHNEVVGAVNAIAQTTKGLLVGAVDGGIWLTTNPNAVDQGSFFSPGHVEWTPVTDQFPSLSIDSLATSIAADRSDVVYAGIADTSSSFSTSNTFQGDGGALTGILRSSDGGGTWQPLGQRPPATPPVVNPILGGVGGALRLGTYYLKYTYVNAGGESEASLESAQFIVTANAAGAATIPQANLPPLPPGVTGFNIYLTPTNGVSGSEAIRYATDVVPNLYDLLPAAPTVPNRPVPSRNTTLPVTADPRTDPAAAPTITVPASSSGGSLAVGSYFLRYTFVGQSGESLPSPEYPFTVVTAGTVPQMTLSEPVPPAATGVNVYLTAAGGAKGTETLYVPTPNASFNLAAAISNEPPISSTSLLLPAPGGSPNGVTIPRGGGQLPVGSYSVKYTWVNGAGESVASPPLAFQIVNAGDFERLTLPALPIFATDARIYLTGPNGNPGSEVLYNATFVTETPAGRVYDLIGAPAAPSAPPLTNTLTWNGPGPAPDPFLGGLAGLNVIRVVPTRVDNQGNMPATPDQEIVLAATSDPSGGGRGGVYLSTDGGRTWSSESARPGSGLPAGAALSDLLFDPGTGVVTPAVFYAGIPGQGVYRAILDNTKPVVTFGGRVGYVRNPPQLPLVWTAVNGPNVQPAANTSSTPLANPAGKAAAPTVNPTGGGTTGGSLPAGQYFLEYTWTDAGGQTLVSPESAQFSVNAGNVPQVTLPAPPAGATAANIYLTPVNGPTGSEILYASGVSAASPFNLSAAPPPNAGINSWPTPYSVNSQPVFTNAGQTRRILFALHDSTAGVVVWTALIQPTGAGQQMVGIFSTIDEGNNWTSWGVPTNADGQPLDPGGQGGTHDAIAADNSEDVAGSGFHLYVGGDAYGSSSADKTEGNLVEGVAPNKWVSIVGNSSVLFFPYGQPHADTRRLYWGGGTLYAATDGGLYKMDNARLDYHLDTLPMWESMNGNLMVNEQYQVAFSDGIITAASQDNGVNQQSGAGQLEWGQVDTGDGFGAQAAPDGSVYSASNGGMIHIGSDFLGFNDHLDMNVNGNPLDTVDPVAEANGQSGQLAPIPWAVNAVKSEWLLFGTTQVYESKDSGDDLTPLGPIAPGSPTITALTYGGMANGDTFRQVAYVAAGNVLTLRGPSGGAFNQINYPGGGIRAIALDPQNWQIAYVLDTNGTVWKTPDAGATWQNLTGNLANYSTDLRSLTVAKGKPDVLLVGTGRAVVNPVTGLPTAGTGGVYRLINPDLSAGPPIWTLYGGNLPNVLTTDLHVVDNIVVVGTFGRGAWLLPSASDTLTTPGVVTINGDDDPTHPNDNIVLKLDPTDPLLLDIFQNSGAPTRQIPVLAVSQIVVNGNAGTNSLTVDFRNGAFNPPSGILFDGGGAGGGGTGTLTVFSANGALSPDVYTPAGGSSGTDNTDGAAINFQNLTPVYINNALQFTLITPKSGNSLLLDSPAAGEVRVSGASGGIGFENATIGTTGHVILNTATNDTAAENDVVTTTATALLAVPNTDVTLQTGTNVPGNVLNLDAQFHDINITQNTIQVVGASPFYFDTLGTINLTNAGNVTVYGVAASDRLVVSATSTVAGNMRLNNGPLVVFNTLTSLHFVGNGGGDSFTIHNPAGTIFAPAGGIQFDSGDQAGSLNVDGGGGAVFIENDNNGPAAWAASLVFSGSAGVNINMTGVAHISDTVPVGQFIDNATDAANTITLDDGSVLGDGKIRATIDSFPVIEFGDKTTLVVNAGVTAADSGDIVYVNYHEIPQGLTAVTINGGAGSDVIRVFSSPAVPTEIDGGDGNDLIAVKSDLTVPLTMNGGNGNDTIYGGAGDSLIDGGTGNNVLRAYGGNATINSNGNDLIYAGDGNVTVTGGAGAETLYGGAGNDLIHGDQGYNILHAGDGNSTVFGGPSGNLIFAGAGNDILHGGAGNDTIYGGPGADQLFGEGGQDVLYAGTGPTSLYGGTGNDLIFGGPAANLLDGGTGNSTLVAGSGPETLQAAGGDNFVVAGPRTVSIAVGSGNNVILGGSGSGTLIQAGGGNNIIVGPAGGGATITATGPSHIWGQGGKNTITGGSGADTLDAGNGGNNVLNGAGADILIGRSATDVLNGGTASFVYPNSTLPDAMPSYTVPQPGLPATSTMPTGADYFGRWTELASSATGTGLSGLAGFGSQPTIAAGATGQYVAWTDQRSGTFAVYVAQHTATGWRQLAGSAQGGGVSGTQGSARQPSLTLDAAGNPIVAWTESTAAGSNIEVADYDPSANGGQGGWTALGNSLSATGVSGDGTVQSPIIVNEATGPVVAWLDSSSGAANVYVKQFVSGAWVALGAGAASGMAVSGAASGVSDLALATDGTQVAVAWTQLVGGIRQVDLKQYSGGAWNELAGSASGGGISQSASDARAPTLAYQAGSLVAAWQDNSSNYWEIEAAVYNGSSWTPAGQSARGVVSNTAGSATQPKLAAAGGTLYLLWADDRIQNLTGNTIALYAKKWNGSQFVEALPGDASGQGISDTGGDPQTLSFTVDNAGLPLVAWSENTGAGPQIFVRADNDHVGAVYYVNDNSTLGDEICAATGAAGNSGLSPSQPLPSIQAVLNAYTLHAGDVIVVDAGTYPDGFTVPAASSGFLVLGVPGHVAAIQGLADLSHANGVAVDGLSLAGNFTATGATNVSITDDLIAAATLDGGSGNQITHDTINGGLTVTGGTASASIEHNTIGGAQGVNITGAGATSLALRDNQITATNTGIALAAAADGQISANDVFALGTALDLRAAFTGPITTNSLHGAQVGVTYAVPAALSANRIHDNVVGIVASIADTTGGLGFVAGTQPNQIYSNTTGVQLSGAVVQNQHIYGNVTGVSGSGSLVSSDLDHANLIELNNVGVSINGPIEFNRIARNAIGIQARSSQLVAHNLIYRNTQTGLDVRGQTDVRIFQNTFYAPSGDLVRIEGVSSDVEVRNNIFWAGAGYDLYIANDSQSGFFSDDNDLHASGTGKIIFWEQDFTDILDWQQDVARFDLHSIGTTVVHPTWSQPRFLGAAMDDYRVFDLSALLRFSSPTIDAGDPLADQGRPANEQNLLTNPGFESGLTGWIANPSGATQTASPAPWDGSQYFSGASNADATVSQTVDLLAGGFTASQLDSQNFDVAFGGRIRSGPKTPADTGTLTLTFLDGAGNVLGQQTAKATNTTDRWELVGGRLTLPVGTRKLAYTFEAVRESGTTAASYLDGAFVYILPTSYAPDLGALGNTAAEGQQSAATHIALRFPDLYTDWEKNRPHDIVWDTYNNRTHSQVRIDLYQDGANGPQLLTNITPGTPDTGRFTWTPATSGIDYGTHGLRIQITLVDNPLVFDRSTETFAVPENTNTFFVNDGVVNPGDVTNAPGSVRNTGKLASSPKPFPNNVLNIYTVGSNQTLTIDAGNYALLASLVISNTSGVGDDEGFTFTGPANSSTPATLRLANPLTHAPLVELTGADFMTVQNLTLDGGQVGLLVDASTHFTGSNLTVQANSQDGLLLTPTVAAAVLDHITAFDNGGNGITAGAGLTALTDSTVHDNLASGIVLTDPGTISVEGNVVYGNGGYGLLVTNNVLTTTTTIGNADLTTSRGNKVYGNFRSGISASGQVLVAGNTVNGQVNSNEAGIVLGGGAKAVENDVFGNYNGIVATGAVLTANRAYHNTGAGIVANGADTVAQNVVYSNSAGIQSYTGGNQLTSNLAYANTALGIGVHGGPGTSVVNNTVYQPLGDALDIDGNSTSVAVRNNIFWSQSGYDISVPNDSQLGFASDFNDLYVSGAGKIGLWQSAARATLTAWQNATLNDLNSLSHDPLFVNPTGAEGVVGYVDSTHDGSDDDFHVQSVVGSFHGGALAPIVSSATGLPVFPTATLIADTSQSPTIDRGAGGDSCANEPSPNGGYINQGADGNTPQASESPASYVLVMSPSGGEAWPEGNTFTIRWRSQDMLGTVHIDLLEGTSPTPVLSIGTGIANTGTHSWTVPKTLAPASDYLVRVTRDDAGATSGASASNFTIAPPVNIYYVNDGTISAGDWTTAPGDDANDGLTPATPKASIQAVLLAYHPGYGDTIRVDAGTYNLTSDVQIPAADSGVTIVGYNDPARPNVHAVLDRGLQNDGSDVFDLMGGNDVTLDRLSITDAALGIQANDTGSQRLTVSNCDIYGNRVGGINLFGYSVTGAIITNNRIHDNNPNYGGGYGITASYGGGHTISDNLIFDHFGSGINASLGTNAAGDTITGNTLHDNGNGINAGGTGTFISANAAYNNAGYGIGVGAGAVAANNTTYGQLAGGVSEGIELLGGEARNNTVYNNYNGITGNGFYDGNQVYQNLHAGIVALGGSTVTGNTVYSNDHGIEADSSYSGPFVNNNLVYGNTTYGIGVHGAESLVTNNTIYQTTGDALVVDTSSANVHVENNILWAVKGHDVIVSPDSEIGFQTDYNDLVVANGNLLGNWEGHDFGNRVDWFNELGFDQHSITADPQFVNPAGAVNDFHVLTGSPTIDAGDPKSDYSNEPAPNGGRINLGYNGNTASAAPSPIEFLQEVSPAGLEKFQVGQTVLILWRSVGLSGPGDTIDIDLLRDGDPSFSQRLADRVPDNGEFDWTIPAGQALAGDYRLRIHANSGAQPQAITPLPFLIAGGGHDYYVNDGSTTSDVFTTAVGNDANSGKSPDQPVASLAALLTAYHFGPGDVIHVDTGTYNLVSNIRLSAQDSGVTIVGPSTAAALFNRGDTGTGANVFELDGATDVTLDHLSVTGGNTGIIAFDTGSKRLTVTNCTVYGNAVDGIQLFGYSITDGHIVNNVVHDNGGYSGIAVGNGAGMIVTGNLVYHNYGDGITAAPGSYIPGYTVSGNTVYGNNKGITASGAGTILSGNTIYDDKSSGIEIATGTVAVNNTVYGQVVNGAASQGIDLFGGEARGNTVFDNYNGIIGSGLADGNRVFHNINAGIIVNESGVVQGNVVYGNDQGIQGYDASNDAARGPYIRNNLVYANTTLGVGLHGGADAQFTNNTVYQPTGNALVIDGPSINVHVTDNILWAQAGYDISVSADNSELKLQSDYNDLYTTGTGVLGQWEGVPFTTRAAWFYQVGLDQHSIAADPQFVDPAGADGVLGYSTSADFGKDDNLHLKPTSPAIDAGDPMAPFENEPSPNGGRVNLGSDGNSPNATPTPLPSVEVVSPVGLDKYQVGQTVPITWRTVGVHAPPGYYSGEIEADQPLAYYRLGEASGTTAHDDSGHALDANYVNTVTLGANGALMQDADTSAQLPGGVWDSSAGYVTLPAGLADFHNGLTLEIWAYPTSAGNGQPFFDLGNGFGRDNIVLARDARSNDLIFQVYSGFTAGAVVRASGAIDLNVWQHFAVTEDAVGNVAIYKNGLLIATGVTAVPLNVTRISNYIAKSNFFHDNFAGSLDEAAIYDHVLTASRLQDHVNHAVFGTVNIDLDVGGVAIMNIANQVPDSGSYAWTVPAAALGSGYQVQVRVNDGTQPVGLSHDTFLVANNGRDYYLNDGSTAGDAFTTAVGDDANSGKTPDAPMATLRAMLSAYTFQPGDVIHVDSGNYRLYRNVLILPQDSGVSIEGPTTAEALLNRGNQNLNVDTIDLAGGTHVTIDHLSISGGVNGLYGSSTASSSYLTLSNDDIKNNSAYAVYLDASNDHALLSGNSVHDNTLRGYGNLPLPAVYVAAADSLITGNQVFGDAAGIQTAYRGGEADRIVVSNNVVRDNDAIGISAGSDVLVTGNNIFNNTTGVYLSNQSGRSAGQVSQNIVHDNHEGFLTDNSSGMTITGNRVYHNSTDGIHLFGGMQAVGNTVYSNPVGILGDNPFGFTPFTGLIDNNLVYANTNQAIVLNGAIAAIVDNNDLYQPVGDALVLKGGTRNVQLYNNIAWVQGGYDFNVAGDSQAGLKSDNNLFNKGPAANAHVGFYNGATQDAFSDWQTASGLDRHSLFADPQWVDIAGADNVLGYSTTGAGYDGGADDNFYLTAGSPAIDRGYSWPALNADMLGYRRQDDPGTANGGSPDYVETPLSSTLFAAGGTAQNFHAGASGNSLTLNLPFAFPFYDGSYSTAIVSSRGFLEFGGSVDGSDGANSDAKLASSRIIAPFWGNLRTDANGNDVFVDTSIANQVTVRWQATSVADGSPVNFAAVLFADGRVRFDYGAGNSNQAPTIGVSFGNGQIFVLSRYDGQKDLAGAASVEFDLTAGIVDIGALEFQASSLQTTPPTMVGVSPAIIGSGGSTGDPISSLQISFSEQINPLDANSSAIYELRRAGSNGFGSADDVVYTIVPHDVAGATTATLAISGVPPGGLPVGNYRFTIFSGSQTSIHDLAGLALDGDSNGTPGGNYVRTFSIVPPQADLKVAEAVDHPTAIEGELLHFTITLDDVAGPQAASQIKLAASLPAGLTLVGAQAPAGTSFDSATGVWSIANLPYGGAVSLVLSATVNAGTAGQNFTASAAVSSSGEPDPNPNNNQDSTTVTVVSSADLAVSQSLDDPRPIEGEIIHYTVTLQNQAGPAAAGPTQVALVLPTGVSFLSAMPDTGTTYTSNTGIWAVPSLAVDAASRLVIAAQVNAGAVATTLTNTATIAVPAQPDPNLANNASALRTMVQPGSDLAVSQTVDVSHPAAGQPVQFTLTLKNNGPQNADDAIIDDLLPDGLRVLSYQTTGGRFSTGGGEGDAAGTPRWYLLGLPAGGTATLVLKVAADSDQVGRTLTNTATVSKVDEFDKNTVNDSSSASITVAARALAATALSVAATEGTPFSGSVATFTDTDAQDLAADFSATIAWGDSGNSTGTVNLGADNIFTITASHVYAEEATNVPVTINIAHTSGAMATTTGTATVADALLAGAIAAAATGGVEGVIAVTLSGATFTDANTGATAADFTIAAVDWGDGNTSTAGLTVSGSGGNYSVGGSHLYAEDGLHSFKITVKDAGGSTTTITGSATVADALLAGATAAAATGGVEGATAATLSGATFTDANNGAAATDFTIATVDWGDGNTSTAGLTVSGSGGNYSVGGSHLYAEDGLHSFKVTVKDAGGSTTTITGSATVADALLAGATAAAATGGVEGVTAATLSGATFTDANTGATAADFTIAAVDWGDGNTSTAGLTVSGSGGNYSVGGSHLYAEDGLHGFTVTVKDAGGSTTTITGSATVADAALTATAAATATGGVEGVTAATLSGATFTDANTGATAADFTIAAVNWGDGSTSTAGLTVSGSGGNYTVGGSHLYAEDGLHSFKITVKDAGGSTTTITGSATVVDASLAGATAATATGGVEGVTAATLSGATFTDANTGATAADFTIAAVNWGDGNTSTAGLAVSGSGGNYIVGGSHLYAEDGLHSFKVTVKDAGGSTTTITGSATVADAALTATAGSVSATEGATFAGTVATFIDADLTGTAADYTATIDWGDASPAAIISGSQFIASGGGFRVPARHAYAEEGTYTLSVVISDGGGAKSTVAPVAAIDDAPLSGTGASIASGTSVSGAVASFSDPDIADNAAEYIASIDWGDGQSGTGAVAAGGASGQFTVSDDHRYSDNSQHTITVTISHGSDQPMAITSTEPGLTINSLGNFALVEDIYVIGSGSVSVSADDGLLKDDTAPSALTVVAGTVTGTQGGTFDFHGDGSFTYTPPASFAGFDDASYTASDARGDQASALVNVLSQPAGVVWKFYESVLNRDPDYGGLQFWTNDFLHGGKTGDIAVGFFQSDELLNQIIGGYYQQYLSRSLDTDGLNYWKGVWRATGGPEGIKAGFAASAEFNRNAGNTVDGWLTALYERILHRAPDPQGFDYWRRQRAAGDTEANIALGFFDSKEAFGNDVRGWFQEYLLRAPSDAELAQYVQQMLAGASDKVIEQAITNLPEYGANPPSSPDGEATPLPDYFQPMGGPQRQSVAARDAVFAQWGP